MSAKSPFATASSTAAPTAAATPGFAAQLYLDGVAHIGGLDFVAIKSRDPGKPLAMFLEVGEENNDGLRVDRVRWSPESGKSTVDVSKGGETATLTFDEAQIAKNVSAAAGAQVQPNLSQQPEQPGMPMPVRLPLNRFRNRRF